MGRQIKTIYKKAEASFNSPEHQKKWQGGIGILVMVVFVLSSVLFNKTVQAVNLAAGNYGYTSGTYGYNAGTSSDQVPAAPTAFSATTPTASSNTTATATLSWTAPTLTTNSTAIATGSGSISFYKVHYSTSSLSSCSGGTSTTTTSASVSLTGLNASTVYYVAICAEDNNLNDSAALASSFTTAGVTNSGSVGGSGSAASIGVTPKAPVIVPVVPVVVNEVRAIASAIAQDVNQLINLLTTLGLNVTRNVKAETSATTSALADAKEFKITLSAGVKTVVANFIAYGTSGVTVKLGSGERRAVTRDAFDTLGDVANNSDKLLTFIEEISNGMKPSIRNLSKEQKQVPAALKLFQQLTGKAKPDFKNAKDDLAWNTLQYRVRFPRDLNAERVGIAKFKSVTRLTPKTTLQWAAVRAYGYVLAK